MQYFRLTWTAVCAAALCVPLAALPQPAEAQQRISGQPALKDMLRLGLKAKRPADLAFLDQVLTMVDNGTLPRSLVESAFFWSRNKGSYPFPYFESALRALAKRQGITI